MITAHPVEAVFALAHKVTPAKIVALVRAMEQELIFLESILHTAFLVLFFHKNDYFLPDLYILLKFPGLSAQNFQNIGGNVSNAPKQS